MTDGLIVQNTDLGTLPIGAKLATKDLGAAGHAGAIVWVASNGAYVPVIGGAALAADAPGVPLAYRTLSGLAQLVAEDAPMPAVLHAIDPDEVVGTFRFGSKLEREIDSIATAPQGATVMIGNVPATYEYKGIDAATSAGSPYELLEAIAGTQVILAGIHMEIPAGITVELNLESPPGPLSETFTLQETPRGWGSVAPDSALELTTSANGQVSGFVSGYRIVTS